MPKRMSQGLINLVLLVGSSLLGILLVEGIMRISHVDSAVVWEPNPELGWRSIPGARRLWTEEGNGLIEINDLGYRDRKRQVEKALGTFRIAVFGDSMTQAVQVNLDQTYCSLLEEKLRKNDPSIEVLNFGVNGYSPVQELLLFKREGPRYHPNLVILALFLDNDVAEIDPNLTVGQAGRPFVVVNNETMHFDYSRAEQSFEDYHQEPFYSLRKYSSLYRLMSDWRWHRTVARQIQGSSSSYIPQRYLLYRQPLQPDWEKAWTAFERVVLEFVGEARRQQVKLVILSVPASQVVNNHAWQNVLSSFPAMASVEWGLEGPERRLRTFADEHNVLLIQPYKAYTQASNGPPLFFGNVGHMTPCGHQLLATIIEDFLRTQGLINGGT